jgi:hypothetical protein
MALYLNIAFKFLYIDTIADCYFDDFNLIYITLEERLQEPHFTES